MFNREYSARRAAGLAAGGTYMGYPQAHMRLRRQLMAVIADGHAERPFHFAMKQAFETT